MAESVAPLMHDPNTREGRDGLGLETDDPVVAATRDHAIPPAPRR